MQEINRDHPGLDNEIIEEGIEKVLIRAAFFLERYPAYLIRILPAVKKLCDSDLLSELSELSELSDLLERNKYLVDIELEFSYLRNQVSTLRDRLSSIHAALCYSNQFSIQSVDDYSSKVSPVEVLNKNSTTTLVVFSGMARRPSMAVKEFYRSLSGRDVNIIFLKDFYQCWYEKGLIGITDDFQSTAEYILSIIPEKTKNLIFLGTSAGGYAAIKAGVTLNANRVVALSPQTNINRRVFNMFKSYDSEINGLDLSKEKVDLKSFLDLSSYSGELEIYYGENNNVDRAAALRLQEYASLKSLPTNTHNVAEYMKSTGKLEKFLDDLTKI
ncbi:hypothetical protein [Psychrobacter sp. Marseille-P5312]|uniref:hypothetical protein n=1 Tax=Psychrobacter sp. Marseille-P5312 TaxID=2086574 RepID=UPI000CF64DF8|nr:hypothetical protein [Psychrobacter sp. Marseille-P5312]